MPDHRADPARALTIRMWWRETPPGYRCRGVEDRHRAATLPEAKLIDRDPGNLLRVVRARHADLDHFTRDDVANRIVAINQVERFQGAHESPVESLDFLRLDFVVPKKPINRHHRALARCKPFWIYGRREQRSRPENYGGAATGWPRRLALWPTGLGLATARCEGRESCQVSRLLLIFQPCLLAALALKHVDGAAFSRVKHTPNQGGLLTAIAAPSHRIGIVAREDFVLELVCHDALLIKV